MPQSCPFILITMKQLCDKFNNHFITHNFPPSLFGVKLSVPSIDDFSFVIL